MRPIHEMLLQAQGHARFHMPGHKGALDPFDMTELPSTDDLYHPQGAIREAERRIAQAAGAGDAILLTGGVARSRMLTDWVAERVSFLAPVHVLPGENEMESLALGVLRVLRGEEEAHTFAERTEAS